MVDTVEGVCVGFLYEQNIEFGCLGAVEEGVVYCGGMMSIVLKGREFQDWV